MPKTRDKPGDHPPEPEKLQNHDQDQDQDQDVDPVADPEEDPEEDGEEFDDPEEKDDDPEETDDDPLEKYADLDNVESTNPLSPASEPEVQENAGKKGKRGRPPKEKEEPPDHPIPFMRARDAAKKMGARADQIRVWAETGIIPGIRYENGLLIPEAWVDGVLDGSVDPPDGIPRRNRREEKRSVKAATAGAGRNQEILSKLQGLYGTDSDLKVELSRRGPAGYAYLQDLPHPPSKAELQGLFPEGGDFQLRIFRNGKVVDEVGSVIVDSIDGTPYSPSQVYARAGAFPRPGTANLRNGMTGRIGPMGEPPGFRSPSGDDGGVGYLARKAADFAFDNVSRKGPELDGVLRTITDQQRTQYETLARSVETERALTRERERDLERQRKEEREEAEQRRREEKEELENQIAGQREDFENQKKIEMEKFKLEQEHMMSREREYLERMKSAEQERTKAMLDSQNQFFQQMRELDAKRDTMMRDSHKESIAMQERMTEAQRNAVEEQRRANDRMFEMQMSHLSDMKNTQEPLALIAQTVSKSLDKIGPVIQARMNPGMGPVNQMSGPSRNLMPDNSAGEQPMFNMIDKIKQQPFFVQELTAIAEKIQKKVHPAFLVNKLLGMMQFDPSVSIVLDYVVTAEILDVIRGVRLAPAAVTALSSQEGKVWWAEFQKLLQITMAQSVQQQMTAPQQPPADEGNPEGQGPSLNPTI